MIPLNASTMSLTGRTLIEASAGTGKTYTIASLYLRYVVEQPLPVELSPEKILVVTFTRAATAELRERIRQRLHLAVACFRGKSPGGDSVIAGLLERFADEKEAVLKRLYAAEKSMDEAAIYTIHGFCHRAISSSGFASLAAHAELDENEEALLLQVVEDFWRQLLYPLTEPDYTQVLQALRKPQKRGFSAPTPQNLMRQLKALLARKDLKTKPEPPSCPLSELIPTLKQRRAQAWVQFTSQWQRALDVCTQELKSIPRARASSIEQHTSAIADWLMLEDYQSPPKKSLGYLQKQLDEKAEFAALGLSQCENLLLAISELEGEQEYRPWVMAKAFAWVRAKLEQEKLKRQVLAPDDLMHFLFEALNDPCRGEALAAELAEQYPVALIDEFQDTDPLQFGIFKRIYAKANHYAWLMIGDPKQSIYGFRGGDIHTYSQAKNSTDAERWLSLGKNYRSTQAMVAAANRLFAHCQSEAFLSGSIAYESVDSFDQGDKGSLVIDGQVEAPLQFSQFDEALRVGEAAGAHCADQIAKLLNAAGNGQALLGQKPVTPGDLAVLVRSRDEAQVVAKALRERQVRSVFLSRDSVFSTEVARELLRLLEAFYQPNKERLLMASLASSLVNWSAAELARQRDDEQLWQQHLAHFQHYHQLWLKRGVLTAIYQWLSDYQIPAAILSDEILGERRLADLLHTAELLQSKATSSEGPYSLLRQFRRWVDSPDENSRSQQLRLESDQDLVQIVTIHASKGLEYPIVFIPFGLAGRVAQEALYPEQGEQLMEFSGTSEGLMKADRERLAEEIRLFYVAITRAEYACYIGLARLRNLEGESALGHLLNCGSDESKLDESLALLSQNASDLIHITQVAELQPSITLLAQQQSEMATHYSAKPFCGELDLSWRLSSYSALASHQGESSLELPERFDDVVESVEPDQLFALPAPVRIPEDNRFSFIKGPQAGNALHEILERQSFADGDGAALFELCGQSLRASAIDEVERWQGVVSEWLMDVLNTRLPEADCSLAELPPNQTLPEMEFFLQVDASLTAQQFNQWLSDHPLLNSPVHPLAFDSFHGLLKGFVDLIFEWQGRFFIVDYKSNHLGDDFSCYTQEALDKAMADHRYDAQLILYTLALHRYLKQKLDERYDYDEHIGGGYYLFLRGISAQNQSANGLFFAKPEKALIEGLDRLFSEQQEGMPCQD